MADQSFNELLMAILERIEKKVDKQNDRVRKLELWRSGVVGGIAVLTIVVVTLIRVLI